jgi:hypothetical protein
MSNYKSESVCPPHNEADNEWVESAAAILLETIKGNVT